MLSSMFILIMCSQNHSRKISVITSVSHFGCKIQNQTVQELELTAKIPGKRLFQYRWLKDRAYLE